MATSVAVAVGYSMPLLGSALMSERVGAPLAEVVYAAGAVALVAVAFASIASLWCRWQWLLAGAAAVVFGQAASLALRDELPFAGTHRLLSTSAFSVGTELGYIVVVITLAVGTVVLIRGSAASRMRILLVSAIIADTAWHRAVERSTTLWQAGWSQSGPSLLILARWIAAVGLLLCAARYLVGRFPHTSTATARAQDVAADVETGPHRDLETRFHTPES